MPEILLTEYAGLTGLSASAVRQRIKRGTLQKKSQVVRGKRRVFIVLSDNDYAEITTNVTKHSILGYGKSTVTENDLVTVLKEQLSKRDRQIEELKIKLDKKEDEHKAERTQLYNKIEELYAEINRIHAEKDAFVAKIFNYGPKQIGRSWWPFGRKKNQIKS